MLRAALVVIMIASSAVDARGQAECPRAALPAYAHNDYENPRPLSEAVELGFRGVEADVFLVDGVLRVGHDRRSAERGRTLEELYLEPLRALAAQCGKLTADARPFLLAIEFKESSYAAYSALLNLLARYKALRVSPSPLQNPAVEAILVGWHPPLSAPRSENDRLVAVHQRIVRPDVLPRCIDDGVRLFSLDYGKTMGRPWITAGGRRRWLAALREMKRAAPGQLLRVHNAPAEGRIYAALLEAGVDLIGTKDLGVTQRLLLARVP